MLREHAAATYTLSRRKLLEKGKGILIPMRGFDEEAAYAALRKLAMEGAQPIRNVAGGPVGGTLVFQKAKLAAPQVPQKVQ